MTSLKNNFYEKLFKMSLIDFLKFYDSKKFIIR
jgi:hypothetical protein